MTFSQQIYKATTRQSTRRRREVSALGAASGTSFSCFATAMYLLRITFARHAPQGLVIYDRGLKA